MQRPGLSGDKSRSSRAKLRPIMLGTARHPSRKAGLSKDPREAGDTGPPAKTAGRGQPVLVTS
jgi:hypothetical protein